MKDLNAMVAENHKIAEAMEHMESALVQIEGHIEESLVETNKAIKEHIEHTEAIAHRQSYISNVVSAIAIIIGLVAAWFITRMIVTPIGKMVTMLKDIAEGEGDLTKRVAINSEDELGDLAKCPVVSRIFRTFVCSP